MRTLHLAGTRRAWHAWARLGARRRTKAQCMSAHRSGLSTLPLPAHSLHERLQATARPRLCRRWPCLLGSGGGGRSMPAPVSKGVSTRHERMPASARAWRRQGGMCRKCSRHGRPQKLRGAGSAVTGELGGGPPCQSDACLRSVSGRDSCRGGCCGSCWRAGSASLGGCCQPCPRDGASRPPSTVEEAERRSCWCRLGCWTSGLGSRPHGGLHGCRLPLRCSSGCSFMPLCLAGLQGRSSWARSRLPLTCSSCCPRLHWLPWPLSSWRQCWLVAACGRGQACLTSCWWRGLLGQTRALCRRPSALRCVQAPVQLWPAALAWLLRMACSCRLVRQPAPGRSCGLLRLRGSAGFRGGCGRLWLAGLELAGPGLSAGGRWRPGPWQCWQALGAGDGIARLRGSWQRLQAPRARRGRAGLLAEHSSACTHSNAGARGAR